MILTKTNNGFLRHLLNTYKKEKCSFVNQGYTLRYQAGLFLEELLPSRALLRFYRHVEDKKENAIK